MNLTKSQLKAQIERAKAKGWVTFFENAARTVTHGYFDTADLLAIGSRESNLDPIWLTKPGDKGNGFGLMQADKRSFPEFTKTQAWKNAETGIMFGAKVLMQKWADYENSIGQKREVKSSKGGRFYYTGKQASGSVAQHIVISGYNSGRWSQYAYAKGQDIDKYSTGHDYGKDVMERAAYIRTLLKDSAADLKPTPAGADVTAPIPKPTTDGDTQDNAVPQPPNIQADNVQINDANNGVAPSGFVPEDKEVTAPPKENVMGTATKATILGIAVPPTIYAVINGIQDWIEKGYIDVKEVLSGILGLIRDNIRYIPYLIGLIILVLIIKKVFKQVTFLLEMYIKARPDLHNVTPVPTPTESQKGLWGMIKGLWS